uniref:Abnormal cell migration protein 18-like fibronectin type I domain-containing protein n=1 Tax=Elaeophora elaphi TaxID=1147741 RepID=A0A0R3RYX2_9BILA
MLRIYLFATILLMVECASLVKSSSNATVWLASPRDQPVIILRSDQMIPSTIDCQQNRKTYKEGETWFVGHLLYKCMKLGAYAIIGCRTRKGRQMVIGETFIDDFIAHQCFKDNSKIYYRESPCDIPGQPSCGSFEQEPLTIPFILQLQSNLHTKVAFQNSPKVGAVASIDRTGQNGGFPPTAGLPQGWKIVDSHGVPVPIDRIRVITSYLVSLISRLTI